jgi:drug/metabolite transporter (DMT)-like permease
MCSAFLALVKGDSTNTFSSSPGKALKSVVGGVKTRKFPKRIDETSRGDLGLRGVRRRRKWLSVAASSSASSARTLLQENKFFNRAVLVLCCFLYGSSYVSTKYMQNRIDAVMVTTLRFLVGSVTFLPVFLRFDANKEVISGGIEVGLWYALGFVAQGIALQNSSASKASFICALGVVVAPLLDLLFPNSGNISSSGGKQYDGKSFGRAKQPHAGAGTVGSIIRILTRWPFLPSLLACAGAAILEFGSIQDPPSISDVLLFVPPMAYSVAVWRCEKISRKLGAAHQPNQLSAYMTLTSCLASGFYAVVQGVFPRGREEWKILGALLSNRKILFFLFYEGCLATAAVSMVEQHILRRLSAAEVTLIYSMEPLFATLTSVFVGEPLTREVLIGAIFILSACVIDCL